MKRRTFLAVAGGTIMATAGALLALLRRPVPPPAGASSFKGLDRPVEVLIDGRGIPHIYAENEPDLFFVQGLTMARERLFQMDFLRRFAAGRLSEIAGETTLEVDRWQRLLGLRRSAEKGWPHSGEEGRAALLAFTRGVNAAIEEQIAGGNLALEFSLLGYQPERWTPVDSLSILRLMALSLSVGWESDLLREGVKGLDSEAAEALLPRVPPDAPIIGHPGLALLKELASGMAGGSNCWVVEGSRTPSGLPLLANDPHLALRLPPLWFAQHLDCPTLKVAGCALAGLPGIVLGHNEHGAWGMTSGYADVQDLYIESRVEGVAEPAFRWGDFVLPATVLEERITVKGWERPFMQRVVITRHGPLISDLLPDEPRDLALRWTIDEPDDAIGALLGLNRAQNWEDFRRALADHGAPPLNFSWAGRDGRIGWVQAGRIPIRQGEAGTLPVDGSTGENEWLGYIPLDELPQSVDPAVGYIVHANNRPMDGDYPHWLGEDFFPGFRAARIEAMIEARATHDLDSFRAIQRDAYSYPEHRLARLVAALPAMSGRLRAPQHYLQEWSGQMSVDSVAATIAHYLFHEVRRAMVEEELGRWRARWEGKVNQPDLQNLLPHAFNTWAWVLERLEEPEHPWWQASAAPQRGARDELLILALQETIDRLGERYGEEPSRWTWGRVHRRTIEHPLGVLPLIGRLFNRGPFSLPGGAFSPNADLSTVQTHQPLPPIGASVRLIADLADWDRYLLSLPGGNSGHPASPHYADGLEGWRQGELQPLPWSREAVERAARGRWQLLPEEGGKG